MLQLGGKGLFQISIRLLHFASELAVCINHGGPLLCHVGHQSHMPAHRRAVDGFCRLEIVCVRDKMKSDALKYIQGEI